MAFLAVAMTAVVFLVTDLLFQDPLTAVFTGLTAGLFAVVWFVLPLLSKAQLVGRLAAQDRREPVGVDVAARDDADELPPRHLPESAAATASAPAPSAITRTRSASSRTAAAVSSSVTV